MMIVYQSAFGLYSLHSPHLLQAVWSGLRVPTRNGGLGPTSHGHTPNLKLQLALGRHVSVVVVSEYKFSETGTQTKTYYPDVYAIQTSWG